MKMNPLGKADDEQQGGEESEWQQKGGTAEEVGVLAMVLAQKGVAVFLLRLSMGMTELLWQITRRDLDEDTRGRLEEMRVSLKMVKDWLGEHGGGERMGDYRNAREEMERQMEKIRKGWETDRR